MSRNGRTVPFPGFSRGVPIVGQPMPQAAPEGKYFYNVVALIRRDGHPLDAMDYEANFPLPMNGVHFMALRAEIANQIKAERPDLPEPRVMLLAPQLLGFVPKEELERQEREAAEKKVEVVQ